MRMKNEGLKSGIDLAELESYIEELDKNNQMCKIYSNPVGEIKTRIRLGEISCIGKWRKMRMVMIKLYGLINEKEQDL